MRGTAGPGAFNSAPMGSVLLPLPTVMRGASAKASQAKAAVMPGTIRGCRWPAGVVRQVLGHRAGIGPVHVRGREGPCELPGRRRKRPVARGRGRSSDQDRRTDAAGREPLRERPACRDAYDGRTGRRRRRARPRPAATRPTAVYPGLSWRVGNRAAGVAVASSAPRTAPPTSSRSCRNRVAAAPCRNAGDVVGGRFGPGIAFPAPHRRDGCGRYRLARHLRGNGPG